MNVPHPEQLLASAARYLVDGHDYDAASLLLASSLTIEEVWQHRNFGYMAKITVQGPRALCEMVKTVDAYERGRDRTEEPDERMEALGATLSSIKDAIKAVMPAMISTIDLGFRGQLVEIEEGWRRELEEIARGKTVHNQAVDAMRVVVWKELRFRSQAEVRIAQALEDAKVLFFPNCKARLGISKRENREPDFLICHKGKLGILEVDGEPYHPPSRTTEDHERDRLFLAHGIRLVQHFDAGECFETAPAVVKKFLYLLDQA